MKSSEEVIREAMKLLNEGGIETVAILSKCPDSDRFGVNISGNRTFLLGVNDIAKDIIKGEIYKQNMPPEEGDKWKEE